MPNHCDQTVIFKGPANVIGVLYSNVLKGRLCQAVRPMPFSLSYTSSPSDSPNWYNWANDNWGTKWDIADPVVLEKSWEKESDLWFSTEDISFTFVCWTAWAPPIPVWQELVRKHQVEIKASYIEESMGFEGTFVNGVIEEWEPSEEPI